MVKCRHRWLGFVIAAAIAFNTLLPFFAVYAHADGSALKPPAQLASIFGEKLLICTGDGFALVTWKDLQSGKAPVKQHKSYFCPLCYIAASPMAKLLLLALAAFFLAGGKPASLSLLWLYSAGTVQSARTASPPRAPPFSFCH